MRTERLLAALRPARRGANRRLVHRALAAVLAVACASSPPEPPKKPALPPDPVLGAVPELPGMAPPLGRLPTDVHPRHYALELHIDPSLDRFSGTVDIDIELAHPKSVIWLHGKKLNVTRATVSGADASYREVESGVASLTLKSAVPAGTAKLHLEWDAAFGRQLRGLYRVDRNGDPYAFTQFEAIAAREAFPSFDEPAFKTPFDVTLVVPKGAVAIANTKETARAGDRITFARTEPLPTYLLAWAVGPLDVIDAPIPANAVRPVPLPFRAIAAKGRGKDLAHAVKHTGQILSTLETWFGIPYPYDKLDVIAVPDREGAMENAGAVTFAEYLLLIDNKTATLSQKRAYVAVMAHELAHQWFGDLVTMPWWNDVWLNEAFATWMGTRATQLFEPESSAELFLLDRIHDAMGVDALTHARAIRQPIESDHDITNAFDSITYQKGAAVLTMFERHMGKDAFQKGIRSYLTAHRHGNATSDDLLSALGPEVAAPFKTFLDRPGVPYLDIKVGCAASPKLSITQSRYFPLGSAGDPKQLWQVPFCARSSTGKETCTVLKAETTEVALEGCPTWVMPNAEGAGYYRFGLSKEQLSALLTKGWPKLSTRERLATVDAVRIGFSRGTARAADVFGDLAAMANDPFPSVAAAPMGMAQVAREWLFATPLRANVEAWARKLYAKTGAALGWTPSKNESSERTILRQSVLSFLTFTARDPAIRKEAIARGRAFIGFGKDSALHLDAIDSNLAGIALSAAAEDGDAAFFDALLAHLDKSDDTVMRSRLLGALASVHDPKLAERALALTLDKRLRTNEVLQPLGTQLSMLETRDAAWQWLRTNFDAIVARISPNRAGALPYYVRYCDEAHAAEMEAFFTPKIAKLDGGPRNLANALESMRLCVARRKAQEDSLRSFFAK
jgi:cytosol alanyl aminopeptidase